MPELDVPARQLTASPTPPSAARHAASYLALIGGAVAIGFAPIFVRQSEVGPVSTAVWRVILATPVLWVISLLATRPRLAPAGVGKVPQPAGSPGRGWHQHWMVIVAGLFFAGDLAVWHWSIRFTSVANSTLLANFAPVYVVFYAFVAHGTKPARRFLLALAVALLGMGLLIGRDIRLDARAWCGDVLGIVTAAFYAGYLISIKRLRGGLPTAIVMARTALVTAISLLPVAAFSGESFLPHSPRGWAAVAGLALVSHVGGQTLIAYALAKVPASIASLTLLIQPVTATLASAFFLGESVAAIQAVGMVLVMSGVFVARREA